MALRRTFSTILMRLEIRTSSRCLSMAADIFWMRSGWAIKSSRAIAISAVLGPLANT